MFLRYFGFDEDPFGATPDPRCLYNSPTHQEALASLMYGFHSNRGFTALNCTSRIGKNNPSVPFSRRHSNVRTNSISV